MRSAVLLRFAAAALAGLTGCGDSQATSPRGEVRDSAGVRIVDHSATSLADAPRWVTDSTPALAIDNREDDPHYLLHRVRDALPLRGGGVALANQGTSEILVYDEKGEWTATAGGSGDGPGEFRFIVWLATMGDSVVAFDQRHRRVSVFDRDWRFVRSADFTTTDALEAGALSPPLPLGVFGDGSVLAYRAEQPATMQGLYRGVSHLMRFDADATGSEELARTTTAEMFFLPMPDGGVGLSTPPFSRQTWTAAAGDRFYTADNDRWEVRAIDATGRLLMMLRVQADAVPVAEEHIRAFIDSRYRTVDDPALRARLEKNNRDIIQHRTLPAFGSIEVSDDGRIWVADYSPDENAARTWTVFSHDGAVVARANTPAGLAVLRVGEDWVIGVETDAFQRERVRRYVFVPAQR